MKIQFGSQISRNLQDKMSIGPDGKMELTPEMMQALGISQEALMNGELKQESGAGYEEVKLSKLHTRPIATSEYEALPNFCKKGIQQLLNIGYFFVLIVMIVMTVLIVRIPDIKEKGTGVTLAICGAMFLLLAIITIGMLMQGIGRNSEITVGEVLSCYASKTSNKQIKYYVQVVFPERKEMVEKVRCQRSTFHRLKVGDPVYICKKRAYASK